MSVLNVIDTQTVSGSGTAYITVKSGVLRVLATSASSIQVNAGPAITLAAGVPELISCGKPANARIASATGANPQVITVESGGTPGHKFVTGDYISTQNGGDTTYAAAFVSAVGSGKVVASTPDGTITTDIDIGRVFSRVSIKSVHRYTYFLGRTRGYCSGIRRYS